MELRVKTDFIGFRRSSSRWAPRALRAAPALIALQVSLLIVRVDAQGLAARAFSYLDPAFTQELIATEQLGPYPGTENDTEPLATVLGGIAFAPDGDVWAANCVDGPNQIHRFDMNGTRPMIHQTATLRPKQMSVATAGGCGLTNHPVGQAMYMNSSQGVRRLSADSGLPLAWPDGSTSPMGAPGNALGIAVDPVTHHLVYAGDDCDDRGPASATCTLWGLDPNTGFTVVYGQFAHDEVPFVDGIYFDPTGNYLFVANRTEQYVVYGQGSHDYYELNRLTIIRRPSGPLGAQIVRHLPMTAEPDGVSFHRNPDFVITNNEDGFSMSRFDFPNGFEYLPAQEGLLVQGIDAATDEEVSIQTYGADIATGGHRGDLSQVGPDGCIYATQGRDRVASGYGTRYNDGTETTEDSIVKICMADGSTFEPPPGVRNPEARGSVAGSAYLDVNDNNVLDEGIDSLLQGVTITLNGGPAPLTANTTDGPVPTYSFTELSAASYTVSAPLTSGGYALVSPESLAATITTAGENITGLNFLYKPGRLTGSVYLDTDDSLSISMGDTFLSGVDVLLTGGANTVSGPGPVPTFSFLGLEAGSYTVTAPAIASGYLQTIAPNAQTLSAGQSIESLNFLYVRGKLSGFAYVDANGNSLMDTGEARLPNVTVTGPGGATRQTDVSGFYEFKGLAAGDYLLSAPPAVGTYTRSTSGSLAASLAAGGNIPNLNFGYVPPPPPPPPGSISGKAYIDSNGNGVYDAAEVILAGVSITLSGAASGSATTTAPAGYSFTTLVAGGYNVSAASTALYNGFTYNLTTPSPLGVPLGVGEHRQNVNFGYRAAVVYTTYTQGGWGAPPNGNNPGMLLQNNFAAVFGSAGVTIGLPGAAGKYHLTFTSSQAIRNFLPAGGAPKALKASATNPTTSAAGVLAGQVLAATLSVRFSNAGVTATGLKDLRIAQGNLLAGQTVEQALALANKALGGGGLPPGVSFSALNDVMTRINENFDNGTSNNGFLVP